MSRKHRDPRYKVDQRIGEVVIVEYMGYLQFVQMNGVVQYDHHYLTICDCGNTRELTQRYLNNPKVTPRCEDCAREAISEGRRKVNEAKTLTRESRDDTLSMKLKLHSMRWV